MKTFEELGICPEILKAITELGYEQPMPVQEEVIPLLLNEKTDIVALAQTGTGKTAAFGLPIIQKTDLSTLSTQTLILSPTRELCLQIAGDLADFAKYIEGLRILPVYGGSSIESQIKALRRGVQVIVATPGRLIDLINRKVVDLHDVHTVILDEADEMLNMGFLDDIKEILTHVPVERKMLMFSATMPKEIAEIAKNFMHDPVEFVAGQRNEGAKNVRHIYYMVKAHDKYLALKPRNIFSWFTGTGVLKEEHLERDTNAIAAYGLNQGFVDIYGIIFCRTRKETQEVADKLIADGYNADCLHGDLSQAQRDMAMRKFRDHVTQLLVATDVAARGLDVDDLTHVINYGLPEDTAVYTHRSGRTGRAGKTGVSVAIIHSREKGRLREIEKKIGKEFEYRKVPTPEHIIEKQLYNLADRLERVEVNESEIAKYLPGVSKKLEWLSGEDLLKRLLSLEFNRLLAYYQNMPDIDLNANDKGEKGDKKAKRDRDDRSAERGMERIYVNVGKRQGFYPGNLMEIVNSNVEGSKPDIGRIDLLPDYTLFDVRQADARRVIGALKGADFFGHRLYAEQAQADKDYGPRTAKGGQGKMGPKPLKGKKKKEKKEFKPKAEVLLGAPEKKKKKKEKKAAKEPKYNGNYDIFIKKKK